MSTHEYSPEEALQVLLNRVREWNEELANRIAEAVDAGKDVSLREPSLSGGKQRMRSYRKVERFTYDEALQVALDVLQAHLLEQPLFVNSFLENARASAVGVGRSVSLVERTDLWNQVERDEAGAGRGAEGDARREIGAEKEIRVEVKTETQIARQGEETVPLTLVSQELIAKQQQNFRLLRDLLTFTER